MTLTLITPLITAWVLLNNVATELTLRASVWFTINLPMLIPGLRPAIVPMAACWPENNTLSSSQLGGLTRLFGGAIGGVINDFVNTVVLVAAIIALVMAITRKGPEFLKRLPMGPLTVIIALACLIAYYAIRGILYNRC